MKYWSKALINRALNSSGINVGVMKVVTKMNPCQYYKKGYALIAHGKEEDTKKMILTKWLN